MEVTVNGKKKNLEGPVTVYALLAGMDIDPETVVVERNLEIVAKDDLASTGLSDGDSLEIIRFVGGG